MHIETMNSTMSGRACLWSMYEDMDLEEDSLHNVRRRMSLFIDRRRESPKHRVSLGLHNSDWVPHEKTIYIATA